MKHSKLITTYEVNSENAGWWYTITPSDEVGVDDYSAGATIQYFDNHNLKGHGSQRITLSAECLKSIAEALIKISEELN